MDKWCPTRKRGRGSGAFLGFGGSARRKASKSHPGGADPDLVPVGELFGTLDPSVLPVGSVLAPQVLQERLATLDDDARVTPRNAERVDPDAGVLDASNEVLPFFEDDFLRAQLDLADETASEKGPLDERDGVGVERVTVSVDGADEPWVARVVSHGIPHFR